MKRIIAGLCVLAATLLLGAQTTLAHASTIAPPSVTMSQAHGPVGHPARFKLANGSLTDTPPPPSAGCDTNYTYYRYDFRDRHDNYWAYTYSPGGTGNYPIIESNTTATNYCVYTTSTSGLYFILQAGTWLGWGTPNFGNGDFTVYEYSVGPNWSNWFNDQEWWLVDLSNGTNYTWEWKNYSDTGDCVTTIGLGGFDSVTGCRATYTPQEMQLVTW